MWNRILLIPFKISMTKIWGKYRYCHEWNFTKGLAWLCRRQGAASTVTSLPPLDAKENTTHDIMNPILFSFPASMTNVVLVEAALQQSQTSTQWEARAASCVPADPWIHCGADKPTRGWREKGRGLDEVDWTERGKGLAGQSRVEDGLVGKIGSGACQIPAPFPGLICLSSWYRSKLTHSSYLNLSWGKEMSPYSKKIFSSQKFPMGISIAALVPLLCCVGI